MKWPLVFIFLFSSNLYATTPSFERITSVADYMTMLGPYHSDLYLESSVIENDDFIPTEETRQFNLSEMSYSDFIDILKWVSKECLFLPYLAYGPISLTQDELNDRTARFAYHIYSKEKIESFLYIPGQFIAQPDSRALWTSECALGIKKGEAMLLLQGATLD